jgi:hypothetical protein
MILHRPLPEDCLIKEVVVSRHRIEAHWRWIVTFTCTQPAAAVAPPKGCAVAVDLGWRKTNEGLRVATVMRAGQYGADYVTLPHEVVGALKQAERIGGHRDKTMLMLDSITDTARYVNDPSYRDGVNASRSDPQTAARRFLANVSWQMAPPALQALAAKLRYAPRITPARLAALAIAWREHQDFRPDNFARLEAWRRRDKHLWLYETNGRNQALGRRLDHYRKVARAIVAGASVVILENFDLAKAAQIEDDRDHPLHASARHQRVTAALHLLRKWIIEQAKKNSASMHWHRGVSTWLCSNCGHRLQPRDPAALYQQCPHCSSHAFDQDAEACRNMLGAWRASTEIQEKSQEAVANAEAIEMAVQI